MQYCNTTYCLCILDNAWELVMHHFTQEIQIKPKVKSVSWKIGTQKVWEFHPKHRMQQKAKS